MQSGNVIEVNDVYKKFKNYFDKSHNLKEKVINRSRNKYEENWVLQGISFEVKKGEAIGLIGCNGCGKSTTLKLLTKIIYPDHGTIKIKGRVSSLLELGAGFHPDLSGYENIYLNAAVFGLTRKEIDKRVDEIIRFSELKDYIDNPIRTYSSGMYMKLAFSVAINVDADILLIDEILGVGDVSFQKKCFERLLEIKAKGTTIVIVSHATNQIEKICDRSIWISNGKIREEGNPKEVHEKYLDVMEDRRISRKEQEEEERRLKKEAEERAERERKEKEEQARREKEERERAKREKEERERAKREKEELDAKARAEQLKREKAEQAKRERAEQLRREKEEQARKEKERKLQREKEKIAVISADSKRKRKEERLFFEKQKEERKQQQLQQEVKVVEKKTLEEYDKEEVLEAKKQEELANKAAIEREKQLTVGDQFAMEGVPIEVARVNFFKREASRLELVVTEKNLEIERLNSVIRQKELAMEKLSGVKDKEINRLVKVISEKEDEIDRLNEVILEKNEEIDRINVVVMEKDVEIQNYFPE